MSHPDTWDAAEQAYDRALAVAYDNGAGELQAMRDCIAHAFGLNTDAIDDRLAETVPGDDGTAQDNVRADLAKQNYATALEAARALTAMLEKSAAVQARMLEVVA